MWKADETESLKTSSNLFDVHSTFFSFSDLLTPSAVNGFDIHSGSSYISYLITAFRSEDQIVAVMPYNRHRDFRVSFLHRKNPSFSLNLFPSSASHIRFRHCNRFFDFSFPLSTSPMPRNLD